MSANPGQAAPSGLLFRMLLFMVALQLMTMCSTNDGSPAVRLEYDPGLRDTFFLVERYVMTDVNGKATCFPDTETPVDTSLPEYRKRPVTGKLVITAPYEEAAYSDTVYTVLDKLRLRATRFCWNSPSRNRLISTASVLWFMKERSGTGSSSLHRSLLCDQKMNTLTVLSSNHWQ